MRTFSSILCACAGLSPWLLGCVSGTTADESAPVANAASALDDSDPGASVMPPIHGAIAVKLQVDLATRLRAHLSRGLDVADFPFPDDLAVLRDVYGVTAMRPLFPDDVSDDAIRARIRKLVDRGRQIDPDVTLPHLERIFLVTIDPAAAPVHAAAHYSTSPDVEYAEPFFLGQLQTTTPPDPLFAQQWAPRLIDAPGAWDFTSGAGQTIAILDSGIDSAHLDLASQVSPTGYDACAGTFVTPTDTAGHGTHVAGIAAAEWSPGTGIAGMAPGAQLVSVTIVDSTNAPVPWCVANGLGYAMQVATVANASFGLSATSWVIEDAVDAAHALDVLLAAASGNDTSLRMLTPGNVERAVTVGAVDETDAFAPYSNSGVKVDVAAPGGSLNFMTPANSVLSSLPGASWGPLSGTSMAAPHVAGLAALIRELQPGWSVEQVRSAIRLGAVDVNSGTLPGFDENLGHGRIDANASVSRYALAGAPPPTANLTRPKYEQCVRGKTHIYGYSDVASSHAGSYELSYSSTLQGAYTLISSGAITGGVAPGEVYLGTVAPATFPSTGSYYLKLETTDTDTGVVSTDYNEIEVCGGCAALPFPPVAWWRFDRASFPVALDSAGANHGAYSGDGGPGPNGRVNDGLGVFGKWTDYMTAPASSPPSFYTMSVQGWIRRSVGQDAVIASYSADGVHGWELGMYSTGAIYFAENLHDGITRVVGTVGMSSLYQWMHVAAVVKPQSGNALAPIKINLYLNGVLDNSLSYTMSTVLNPPLSSPTYRVGSAASLTGMGILSFPGNIDEIQVFNQALPASAVASSHAAKCGGNCL